MAKGVVEVHVKRSHGVLHVQSYGRSPKGTKFLIESVQMDSAKTNDEGFKGELSQAVEQINS